MMQQHRLPYHLLLLLRLAETQCGGFQCRVKVHRKNILVYVSSDKLNTPQMFTLVSMTALTLKKSSNQKHP